MEALGFQGQSFIFQLINFALVVFLLNKFLYVPVQNALKKRQDKISKSLKDAELIEERLAKVEAEVESRLDKASSEASRILAEAKKSSVELGEMMMRETEAKNEKLLAEANERIKKKEEELMSNVREQVGELAKAATEKVLTEYLSKDELRSIDKKAIGQVGELLN